MPSSLLAVAGWCRATRQGSDCLSKHVSCPTLAIKPRLESNMHNRLPASQTGYQHSKSCGLVVGRRRGARGSTGGRNIGKNDRCKPNWLAFAYWASPALKDLGQTKLYVLTICQCLHKLLQGIRGIAKDGNVTIPSPWKKTQ